MAYLPCSSVHSYRTLATEHEALMQKYLHLLQIVETEKTVAKQLRQQIEDGEIEIERLKAEVTDHLGSGGGWPGGPGLRPQTRAPAGSGRHMMGKRDPLQPRLCQLPNLKSVMLAEWEGPGVRSGVEVHLCHLPTATWSKSSSLSAPPSLKQAVSP